MFESDDPENDVIGGTEQQRQLIYMTANEMMVLLGCSRCGARLVDHGKRVPGARMIYPQGTDKRTAVGTPLCAQCYRKEVRDA
jgi:hypothetical protein